MSRQNRLNAGAEYVLCRLLATLQDREGIHAESLLACLGALAGYACQVSARRTPLSAASVPNSYLIGTPVSVCALVARTAQKLGRPQPDADEVIRHVTLTLGTSEFGVPRVPAERRPRHLPVVYLKQIWPQIVPIAQPFCRRPAQLPVLFGIALQRAIEITQRILDPTLGASIAMESAVAMSKAVLPQLERRTANALPAGTTTPEVNALPPHALPPHALPPHAPPAPLQPSPIDSKTSSAQRKKNVPAEPDVASFNTWAWVNRLAPARNAITVAALALVAMAGTMLSMDRGGEMPEVARETRLVQALVPPRDNLPVVEEPLPPDPAPIEETQVVVARNETPVLEEPEAPYPMPEQPTNEGIIADDFQSSFDSSPGGDLAASALGVDS